MPSPPSMLLATGAENKPNRNSIGLLSRMLLFLWYTPNSQSNSEIRTNRGTQGAPCLILLILGSFVRNRRPQKGKKATLGDLGMPTCPVSTGIYSKPQKVGNRIQDNQCWDSLYTTVTDWGYWVFNFWASTTKVDPWDNMGNIVPQRRLKVTCSTTRSILYYIGIISIATLSKP